MDNNKGKIKCEIEGKIEVESKSKSESEIKGEIEVKIEDISKDKTEEKIIKLICVCAFIAILLLCAVTIFIGFSCCKCKMPNREFIILIKSIALILIVAIICLTIIVGMRLKNKENLKKQKEIKRASESLCGAYKEIFKKCKYCSCVCNAKCKKPNSSENDNSSKESNDGNKC